MISPAELRAMQQLAQVSWRLEPTHVDVTVAELAYAWGVGNRTEYASEWRHRLWLDGEEALAWAWLFPPGTLEWQVHPGHPELLEDVLDWFESEVPQGERATSVRSGDTDAIGRLHGRGFGPDEGAPWMRLNVRGLEEIEVPHLPSGFRLLTMADSDADMAARVAVHQASWRELGTRVTQETYANVVRTWPYRPDLDLVVEAPDGSYAAFALAWYDPENRVGELEPVGTDPRFRHRGLGRAVNLYALERLREVGARRAIVGSRGDDGYPVPRRLYESVGFRELSRNLRYVGSNPVKSS